MTLKISSLALKEECTTENLNQLSDMIWSRKDSLMFVIGSNPCIRAIYLKAILEEKTQQFSYCHIHKMDYILGKVEEKIENKLLEIIKKRKKIKIFLYISCMEMVTAVDLDRIIDEVKAMEESAEIFIIKRGPMVKRYLKPKKNLEEILMALDPEKEEIDKIYEEPVFAGEVEILASSLEYTNYKKCIIEPGGCVSCINKNGSKIDKKNLYSTTFNDIDMTLGLEKQIIKESAENFNSESVIFLETILPQIAGFDKILLEDFFLDEDRNAHLLSSEDGKGGFKLLENAHFIVLNDIFKNSKRGNKILICAYSNLRERLQKNLWKNLDKEKYIVKLEKELPEKLAIVNLEGLIFKQVYYKFEKIPYEIIYPKELDFNLTSSDKNKKILILGDPIQILGCKKILREVFKITKIKLGFYYPYVELTDEIKEFFRENNIKHYNKAKEIASEIDKNTILIGDKQINYAISNMTDFKYEFIEMPYHWLSGYKK